MNRNSTVTIGAAFATLLAALLLPAGTAAAQEAPDATPIDITARDSTYDVGQGVWQFAGDVRISYGSLVVLADSGTVHHEDDQITVIEVSGSPSRWRDVLDDGSEVSGEAGLMHFDLQRNLLEISGDARVQHPRGVFSSARLSYDLNSKTLSGVGENGSRVRMTIEPERQQERE